MKKFMTYSLSLLLCSALFVPQAHGVTKVVPNTGGGAASGVTFQKAIQAKAFHKPSGTLVAGLAPFASENALGFASTTVTAGAAGSHAIGDTVPTYTGIAESTATAGMMAIRNSSIHALDIANDITDPENFSKAKIFFLSSQGKNNTLATSNVGHPLMVITTTAIPSNPNALFLTDADSADQTCYTMTLVAGNAYGTLNKTYAFVAVKDADGHDANRGNFSAHAGDGIVAVTCGDDDYTMAQADKEICSNLVITSSLAVGQVPLVGENRGVPAMCYDETLKCLYVGVSYTTSNIASHNTGGIGVRIFGVDPDGAALTNRGAFKATSITADGGSTILTGSHIIGIGSGGTGVTLQGTRASLTYHNLKVMHTSTGPVAGTKFAYLIVNGGNGHRASTAIAGSSAVSNRIWSVPLTVGNDSNVDGRFANVNTANYKAAASEAGDLFLTNTAAVRVGNGPLPCPAATKPTDMWVDGDAVYCSIGGAPGNTNSPGIYHSQACFNQHGQIDHWTEWRKVAPNELGDAVNDGGVSKFAVDATTTRIWAVDDTGTSLRLSSWEKTSFDADTITPAADAYGLLTNLNFMLTLSSGRNIGCS